MKLRMVWPRAVASCNRARTGMLALAATGALALTAATVLALGGPAAGVQAAVASNAPSPAQAGTVPLPEMLRGAGTTPAASSGSAVPATPAPLAIQYLDGVYCTSRTSCWAVGSQNGTGGVGLLNQAMHWNGSKWRKVSVPNPGGTGSDSVNELYAVRCTTAANCWAVGARSHGGALVNQALHWDGKKWTAVHTPNPGGTGNDRLSELNDSTCVTPTNCWAVGDFGSSTESPTETRTNQVLHWNGKKWTRLRVANPAGTGTGHVNTLYAVRCLSASNCNAVGDYGTTSTTSGVLRNEALHWNGKTWSPAKTPNPGGTKPGAVNEAFALGCAVNSCWAAGTDGSTEPSARNLNEMLHWNGKNWAKTTTPNPDGTKAGANNELGAITCLVPADCWAVGNSGSNIVGVGVGRNVALHWNGRKWRKVATPNPAGTATGDVNILLGVRCVAAGNCWAVGAQESATGIRDEILHWNGTKWSDVQLFSLQA
jgi:hypothetical protein